MRVVLLALLPACAVAEVPAVQPADVAHLLYLNRCADGCFVYPGDDDSRTNHSSIVTRPTILLPVVGTETWWGLTSCMRQMYEPFDLEITTEDPGDTPHFELIVAGYPAIVGLASGGGAAPATCPNDVHNNVVAFVFAQVITDPDGLCWAAAQETGHLFGLDHVLHRDDPMTWISSPRRKPNFQDVDGPCGEFEPRWCACNRETQNSFEVLMQTLGPRRVI